MRVRKPRAMISDDFLESLTLKTKNKGDRIGFTYPRDVSPLALLGRREQGET